MTNQARMLKPAVHNYSGGITNPGRWATWTPRTGDILVTTPPKCGTTWTQTILTMLVYGGADLPDKVPVLSPWVDADLGVPPEEVAAAINGQPGRRVIKTHTPADGFPVWEGVTVVAVYRHPLDVFFSMRKHVANTVEVGPSDLHFQLPVSDSFRQFIDDDTKRDDFGRETLAKISLHYRETACSNRLADLKLFHYTDMLNDPRGAVEQLARAIGVDDAAVIDRVAEATSFSRMKADAASYAPVAGTGYWKSDANFFDSASSRKWEGKLSEADLDLFRKRLEELVPDSQARDWLENGNGQSI